MILSAGETLRRISEGTLTIRPYSAECQQPASYDLRVAEKTVLEVGRCTLAHTLEWVELPPDLAATLRCRSSFARMGVLLGGGFIDPGFRGQLTLCLFNAGMTGITLERGDRVVQMVLHEVLKGETTYQGRYQDSLGVVGAR